MDGISFFVRKTFHLPTIPHGWGNGYVTIPEWHPFYGKNYVDIPVGAHGGLTFSAPAKDLDWQEIPKNAKNSWIIGFDTCHWGDTLENWPKERVVEETKILAFWIKIKASTLACLN